MIDISEIALVDFNNGATIRLISTAYIEEPALKPLTDNEEELRILEVIEMQTSIRHNNLLGIPKGVNPEELLSEHHGFGWTYINAAFCYTRSSGNRFSSTNRGAWYASYGEKAIETSQAEVAFHLTKELENVGVYDNITNYRELFAGLSTEFYDLKKYVNEDFLSPKENIAYPAGQALANQIRQNKGNGVLFPSQRHKNGKCMVAFKPHIIQNIRHGATWQFNWNGKKEPTISKVVNFG